MLDPFTSGTVPHHICFITIYTNTMCTYKQIYVPTTSVIHVHKPINHFLSTFLSSLFPDATQAHGVSFRKAVGVFHERPKQSGGTQSLSVIESESVGANRSQQKHLIGTVLWALFNPYNCKEAIYFLLFILYHYM